MRKLVALMLVGLMLAPVLADNADANAIFNYKSYSFTGTAYVSKDYRYVGFTPEKITIKTNYKWYDKNSPFRYLHEYTPKTLTVKLYSWATYPYEHWFVQDQKTFYQGDFTVRILSYTKGWWFWETKYVKFVITIPKDKSFFHHNSGKTKIWVRLTLEGSTINVYSAFSSFIWDATVTGSGKYWTNPTPWDKYQKYWGYSASAQEYNELTAQQQTQGTLVTEPIEFDTVDAVLISLFVLGVAILSYVYISDKRKKRIL